jgi:hypothetical protein
MEYIYLYKLFSQIPEGCDKYQSSEINCLYSGDFGNNPNVSIQIRQGGENHKVNWSTIFPAPFYTALYNISRIEEKRQEPLYVAGLIYQSRPNQYERDQMNPSDIQIGITGSAKKAYPHPPVPPLPGQSPYNYIENNEDWKRRVGVQKVSDDLSGDISRELAEEMGVGVVRDQYTVSQVPAFADMYGKEWHTWLIPMNTLGQVRRPLVAEDLDESSVYSGIPQNKWSERVEVYKKEVGRLDSKTVKVGAMIYGTLSETLAFMKNDVASAQNIATHENIIGVIAFPLDVAINVMQPYVRLSRELTPRMAGRKPQFEVSRILKLMRKNKGILDLHQEFDRASFGLYQDHYFYNLSTLLERAL